MNEKKYLQTGQRLEEERVRLGLNKSEMAALGGVANSAYGNYEKGERSPSGEFLTSIALRGVDVQYVLTGSRSTTANTLSSEEQNLLHSYRKAGEQKRIIRDVANAFANLEKGKKC